MATLKPRGDQVPFLSVEPNHYVIAVPTDKTAVNVQGETRDVYKIDVYAVNALGAGIPAADVLAEQLSGTARPHLLAANKALVDAFTDDPLKWKDKPFVLVLTDTRAIKGGKKFKAWQVFDIEL